MLKEALVDCPRDPCCFMLYKFQLWCIVSNTINLMEIEYPDGEFKDKPQAELCVWCVAREVLRIFLEAPENPFFGLVRRRRVQAETTQAIGAPSSGKALIPAV